MGRRPPDSTRADDRGAGERCAVVPLFSLRTKWTSSQVLIDDKVCVLRQQARHIARMEELLESDSDLDTADARAWACRIGDPDWWLVVKFLFTCWGPGSVTTDWFGQNNEVLKETEERPLGPEEVHRRLARSFLTTLGIVRSNQTLAPVMFAATGHFNGVVELQSLDGAFHLLDVPFAELPCPRRSEAASSDDDADDEEGSTDVIGDQDVETIVSVWKRIVKLRAIYKEASVVEPSPSPESFAELRRCVERDEKETDDAEQRRLARAVDLFETGSRLPSLHAFLSMCIVLETVYVNGSSDVTHKLSTRLARILGSSLDRPERQKLYDRAKKTYDHRSKVVHGSTLLHKNPNALPDASDLARRTLRCFLSDEKLFDLFSSADGKRQDRFFLALDLGSTLEEALQVSQP